MLEVVVGDVDDGPSRPPELPAPGPVVLPRTSARVPAVPVDLERYSCVRPGEVEDPAPSGDVHLVLPPGGRETRSGEQPRATRFQWARGRAVGGHVNGERLLQLCGPGEPRARAPRLDFPQLGQVGQPFVEAVVERGIERTAIEPPGYVGKCPRSG